MNLLVSLSHIRLKNFLSFGTDGINIALLPLNVFIGPNASGKSNLLQALRILQAAPDDITEPFSKGGGTPEFLWKGEVEKSPFTANIELSIKFFRTWFIYNLNFSTDYFGKFVLHNETIDELEESDKQSTQIYSFKGRNHTPFYRGNQLVIVANNEQNPEAPVETGFNPNETALRQLADIEKYREIVLINGFFKRLLIYQGWSSGFGFKPRHPMPVDVGSNFLNEDASNLPGVINKFDNMVGNNKKILIGNLQKVYPEIINVTAEVIEHQLYLRFHEKSMKSTIPAVRQSDGVLRFLCLLVILLHPAPPAVVCLEEPEIGLHPDAIRILGKLMKEASKRTQLLVTTHSDILVSELSDTPESIVICERDNNGTHMTRLDPEKYEKWLKEYSLGDLWLRGDIGGTL